MRFASRHLGLALGAILALMPLGLSISCLKGKSPAETTPVWTLTASAGDHGTISPSGALTLDAGSSQTFTVTPASGYAVESVQVGSQEVYTQGKKIDDPFHFTLTIQGRYTVVATFVKICTITASVEAASVGHGTITPAGSQQVRAGSSPAYAIAPKATGGSSNLGYHISALTLDGVDVTASINGGTYTLAAVQADHVLVAAFAENTKPITPPTITALTSDYAFLVGTSDQPVLTAVVDYDQTGPVPVYTWSADHGTLTGTNPATYTAEAAFTGTASITLSVTTGGDPVSKTLHLPVQAAVAGAFSDIFGAWVDHVKIGVETDGEIYAASRNGNSGQAPNHTWGGGLGVSKLAPGGAAFGTNSNLTGADAISWLGLAVRGTDAYSVYKDDDQGGKAYVLKNGAALGGAVSADWVNTPCIAVAPSPANAAKNAVYLLYEAGPTWPPDSRLLVYDEGATEPAWTDAAVSAGTGVKILSAVATDALALALDGSGRPYVAYAPAGGKVQVVRRKTDKSGYEVVGTDLSLGPVYDAAETDGQNQGGMKYSLNLAFDASDVPYVCFLDGGASPAFLLRCLTFDAGSSAWIGVGNSAGSVSWSPQGAYAKAHYATLAVASDGTVCLAFKDKADGSGDKLTALMTTPNGSLGGWARMGKAYLSSDWVNWTSLALGADRKAWFLFKDGSIGGNGSVIELDASVVVTVP